MPFLRRFHPVPIFLLSALLLAGCARSQSGPSDDPATNRLQPYAENPHYFAWGNTPIFLLGATGYHSWTPISRPDAMDYEAQLDRLARAIDAAGSPHVRGFVRVLPYDPMNHLHDGPVEYVLQPWIQTDDGRYDLRRFEPAWEERLRDFLDAAREREIVAALEVWDDWSVTRGPGGQYDPGAGAAWNAHPFNPINNVNYEASVLPETTAVCNAPFYSTVPARQHIQPVLALQKRYVDRLLDIAGRYPNVMINIANESRAHRDWSHFWAQYVRERVPDGTLIGEMPSTNGRDGRGECEAAFHPGTLAADSHYDYVDVSQAVSGHAFESARQEALGGARRIAAYRDTMQAAGMQRPIVVSKDYTRAKEHGNLILWSRFMGGAASARFHRLGVNHEPEVIDFQHEAVTRLGRFIAEVPFWRMRPAPGRIGTLPGSTGANVLAAPDGEMVIQLVGKANGQPITVDATQGTWIGRWVNPNSGAVVERFERDVSEPPLTVSVPDTLNHRILHLKPAG